MTTSHDIVATNVPRITFNFKNFTDSVIAASVSNMIGTAAGYPFDTIKVRMAMSTQKTTMTQSFTKLIKNEGLNGLFKGMSQPLAAALPQNVIVFVLGYNTKKYL